jgi:orotate phosphoribosyltransferase
MELVTRYLNEAFDGKKWPKEFSEIIPHDTVLVGTGLSGTLACVRLAYTKTYKFCIVRKEGCHSHLKVEGFVPERGDKWMIVDDCVESGNTVRTILKVMFEEFPECQEGFQGLFLTESNEYFSAREAFIKSHYDNR